MPNPSLESLKQLGNFRFDAQERAYLVGNFDKIKVLDSNLITDATKANKESIEKNDKLKTILNVFVVGKDDFLNQLKDSGKLTDIEVRAISSYIRIFLTDKSSFTTTDNQILMLKVLMYCSLSPEDRKVFSNSIKVGGEGTFYRGFDMDMIKMLCTFQKKQGMPVTGVIGSNEVNKMLDITKVTAKNHLTSENLLDTKKIVENEKKPKEEVVAQIDLIKNFAEDWKLYYMKVNKSGWGKNSKTINGAIEEMEKLKSGDMIRNFQDKLSFLLDKIFLNIYDDNDKYVYSKEKEMGKLNPKDAFINLGGGDSYRLHVKKMASIKNIVLGKEKIDGKEIVNYSNQDSITKARLSIQSIIIELDANDEEGIIFKEHNASDGATQEILNQTGNQKLINLQVEISDDKKSNSLGVNPNNEKLKKLNSDLKNISTIFGKLSNLDDPKNKLTKDKITKLYSSASNFGGIIANGYSGHTMQEEYNNQNKLSQLFGDIFGFAPNRTILKEIQKIFEHTKEAELKIYNQQKAKFTKDIDTQINFYTAEMEGKTPEEKKVYSSIIKNLKNFNNKGKIEFSLPSGLKITGISEDGKSFKSSIGGIVNFVNLEPNDQEILIKMNQYVNIIGSDTDTASKRIAKNLILPQFLSSMENCVTQQVIENNEDAINILKNKKNKTPAEGIIDLYANINGVGDYRSDATVDTCGQMIKELPIQVLLCVASMGVGNAISAGLRGVRGAETAINMGLFGSRMANLGKYALPITRWLTTQTAFYLTNTVMSNAVHGENIFKDMSFEGLLSTYAFMGVMEGVSIFAGRVMSKALSNVEHNLLLKKVIESDVLQKGVKFEINTPILNIIKKIGGLSIEMGAMISAEQISGRLINMVFHPDQEFPGLTGLGVIHTFAMVMAFRCMPGHSTDITKEVKILDIKYNTDGKAPREVTFESEGKRYTVKQNSKGGVEQVGNTKIKQADGSYIDAKGNEYYGKKTTYTKSEVDKNSKLTKEQRIAKANKEFGIIMDESQQTALLNAHEVGAIGENIGLKAEILSGKKVLREGGDQKKAEDYIPNTKYDPENPTFESGQRDILVKSGLAGGEISKNQKLYLCAPTDKGYFDTYDALNRFKRSISFFEFTITGDGTTATFNFIGKYYNMSRMLELKNSIIEPVCDIRGLFFKHPKNIKVLKEGELKLEGDKWVVTKKMEIELVEEEINGEDRKKEEVKLEELEKERIEIENKKVEKIVPEEKIEEPVITTEDLEKILILDDPVEKLEEIAVKTPDEVIIDKIDKIIPEAEKKIEDIDEKIIDEKEKIDEIKKTDSKDPKIVEVEEKIKKLEEEKINLEEIKKEGEDAKKDLKDEKKPKDEKEKKKRRLRPFLLPLGLLPLLLLKECGDDKTKVKGLKLIEKVNKPLTREFIKKGGIHFDSGKYEINATNKAEIDTGIQNFFEGCGYEIRQNGNKKKLFLNGEKVDTNPGKFTLFIRGVSSWTNYKGVSQERSDQLNENLAQNRQNSIRDYLIETMGLAEDNFFNCPSQHIITVKGDVPKDYQGVGLAIVRTKQPDGLVCDEFKDKDAVLTGATLPN